ncbi:MAG: exodeoxyribonuclease III [Pseudomonadales bacterium]
MRIINFCAEGLEAAAQKGFFEWATRQDADFICVQDLRVQEYDIKNDACFASPYNAYFFDAVEKNTNGVAIYCRELPKAIMTGLGFGEFDVDGLYVQADFERYSVGSFLAPYAAPGDAQALERKIRFYDQFLGHLSKVRNKRREYILTGNWNIAFENADAQNPQEIAGFLEEERDLLGQLYDELGYADAFRLADTDDDEYTWWPEGERDLNGWRVDTQVVSEGLRNTVEQAAVYRSQEFSNHAPVIIDYELEF